MQEYWFCEACKSMNRASARLCYRCRAPKESSTMATVRERQPGTVLTPGLDEADRQLAWTLMARHRYQSAWQLGYVSAGLLAAVGVAVLAVLVLELGIVVSRRSVEPLPATDPLFLLLLLAVLALPLLGLAAVVAHSIFLALTTLNAPALGGGSPRFDPLRAGLWWIESTLWAIRAGLAFVVPPFVCLVGLFMGGLIFGLASGIVWFVLAYWLLGDPITSLTKPRRLLQDLYERLAIPGSPDTRVVSWWALCWGAARGISYATAAVIYLAIMVVGILSVFGLFVGFEIEPASPEQSALAFTVLAVFVGLAQLICDGIAWYLLVVITVELSRRQRAREAWVLSGVSPWLNQLGQTGPAGPPGAGDPSAGPPQAGPGPGDQPEWETRAGPPPDSAPPG
jgi:hypothetical protein